MADLPVEVVRELDITVVTIPVRFGDKLCRDSVDLTSDQFYQMLKESKALPTHLGTVTGDVCRSP